MIIRSILFANGKQWPQKCAREVLLVLVFLSFPTLAPACNIPVFRYALERWQPDKCQVVVFHEQELSQPHVELLSKLQGKDSDSAIPSNLEVIRSRIGAEKVRDLVTAWDALKNIAGVKPPYVALRIKLTAGRSATVWHGSIDEAAKLNLVESPARKKLAQRLLAGDSVVWLMLKSPDESQNEAVRGLMKKQFEKLSAQIKLPDGIGLPGSELHSEVPLLLQFSLIEIDPKDEKETFLVKLISGLDPESIAKGEPMVAPVFGRGRALEVMPASMLNDGLVEDLTLFLCGACSCQVKEKNPGFDLLIAADWDRQLFGESGEAPPPVETLARDPANSKPPVLLAIPPGRKK